MRRGGTTVARCAKCSEPVEFEWYGIGVHFAALMALRQHMWSRHGRWARRHLGEM